MSNLVVEILDDDNAGSEWRRGQREMLAIMQHSLPKSRTRTNVVTTQYTPRGQLFGAYATRGLGSTHTTWRFPQIVKAIMKLASTRPSGHEIEPFLSAH